MFSGELHFLHFIVWKLYISSSLADEPLRTDVLKKLAQIVKFDFQDIGGYTTES